MRKKRAAKKPGKRIAAPPAHAAAHAKPSSRSRLRAPRLLSYVDAVARYGSIRKAADALNVASSALNRQILDLEMDLGAPLFERLPRGVRVTSAGEAFLVYARLVISELKAVESQIEQLRGLVRGQVSVAAAESVAGELLPSAITEFQATHPYVRFHVRIGAPGELIERGPGRSDFDARCAAQEGRRDCRRRSPGALRHGGSRSPARQPQRAALARLPGISAGAGRHNLGRTRPHRAGAGTSIIRPRSPTGFELGRGDEGFRSYKLRRLLPIPQSRQGADPTRRHGGSSIDRSTFAASTIAARNATKSRASGGGSCVR